MKRTGTVLALLAAVLLLSGCGKRGIQNAYTAQIDPQAPQKVAELYYGTLDKAIQGSQAATKDLAAACIEVGKQLGQPLAPAEAISPRTKMAVSGTGKEFDIIESIPPESLLPLAKERTAQVQAISSAIRRTAEMARIEVSAPAGYVSPAAPQSGLFDDFFPAVLDELPAGKGDSGAGVPFPAPDLKKDGYADVLNTARKRMQDEGRARK